MSKWIKAANRIELSEDDILKLQDELGINDEASKCAVKVILDDVAIILEDKGDSFDVTASELTDTPLLDRIWERIEYFFAREENYQKIKETLKK